jgi:transposase
MDIESLQKRFERVSPFLDEKRRRILAAAEAEVLGYGGVTKVARATGLSRVTITQGIKELNMQPPTDTRSKKQERVRKIGGGRKKEIDRDPTIVRDLEALIEPYTSGDPESSLRWTCKSVRRLSNELNEQGHQTSHRMVAELLNELGYSLQANRKTLEGASHPDRDAQFKYIHKKVKKFQTQGSPVISVDTKKKELVGRYKNNGKELCLKGMPESVNVHDFEDKELGKVAPYGVFDLSLNEGWVNVGIDHDTSAFAVESIRRWWDMMGSQSYPGVEQLLITADSGGSNGVRVRLWKTELQNLANETGLNISVCHLPPGTSKWNKIEHQLFSYISQNWRGKPLVSHEVIVNLIAGTTTTTGLKVRCQMDNNKYPKGIKISDDELNQINIKRASFHGEWNYTIKPSVQ